MLFQMHRSHTWCFFKCRGLKHGVFFQMHTSQTWCFFKCLGLKHCVCFQIFYSLIRKQKVDGRYWRDRKTTKIKWAVEWPLFWPAHPWPQRLALELTGEIQLTRSITQQLVSRWIFFGLSANLVFLPSFVYRVDGQWCCFLVHDSMHHWPSTML